MKKKYYEKLVFFLNYSGIGENDFLDLDILNEEELKTLHDIVYASNEEEKVRLIELFYQKLKQKQEKFKKEVSSAKTQMEKNLNILTEFLEKISADQDIQNQLDNF